MEIATAPHTRKNQRTPKRAIPPLARRKPTHSMKRKQYKPSKPSPVRPTVRAKTPSASRETARQATTPNSTGEKGGFRDRPRSVLLCFVPALHRRLHLGSHVVEDPHAQSRRRGRGPTMRPLRDCWIEGPIARAEASSPKANQSDRRAFNAKFIDQCHQHTAVAGVWILQRAKKTKSSMQRSHMSSFRHHRPALCTSSSWWCCNNDISGVS